MYLWNGLINVPLEWIDQHLLCCQNWLGWEWQSFISSFASGEPLWSEDWRWLWSLAIYVTYDQHPLSKHQSHPWTSYTYTSFNSIHSISVMISGHSLSDAVRTDQNVTLSIYLSTYTSIAWKGSLEEHHSRRWWGKGNWWKWMSHFWHYSSLDLLS